MRGFQLIAASALSFCLALLTACDSGAEKREDLEAAAAAALGEGKDDKAKELEAAAAEKRRLALEEKKAKEAAEQAVLDDIAKRVVKAPDKPSKKLDQSCDALMVIYEEWVKTVYFDDDGFQLDFFDHKRENLGKVKTKWCAKLQSIPATDCIVEVIKGVSAEDFSEEDAKRLQAQPDFLFKKCVEQFAPELLE